MADNPLITRAPPKDKPPVTKEMLDDLAYRSNLYSWVRQSGQLYFVNKMENSDGEIVHYLDRATASGGLPK